MKLLSAFLLLLALHAIHVMEVQSTVVDCVQSEWGAWDTNCSRTCNGGLQYRHRTVLQQPWSSTFNYTTGVCACDMVLLIDTSYSMTSSEWAGMVAFAKAVVDQLTTNKLGLVTFDKTVSTVSALTNDQTALYSAIDGIVRCDGYNRVDCYERHTYDAIPVAQQLLEQEMNANPYRSACRVVLTVTQGSAMPAAATTTATNLNALTTAHPDWGLMVAAVGPNAWIDDLQTYATSLLYVTEVSSYEELPDYTSGVLSQCGFPKSSLLSPGCKCDYIIGFDTTWTTLKYSGFTSRDTVINFALPFAKNLIDLTASGENPNRFAFFTFGVDVQVMTTNTTLYPANSSDLYFFPNYNSSVYRNAMYTNNSAGAIIRSGTTSALGTLPLVATSPTNASNFFRKTFDGLTQITNIMEMNPEASLSTCKMLVLFMNWNHSNPHLSAANAGIINYIKGRHPEWGIVIVTVNASDADKKNYYANLTNTGSISNVLSFVNYTVFKTAAAPAVLQKCTVPDQPTVQYPVPCGPASQPALCNTQPCPNQDCQLSDWVEVESCSVTCGTGMRRLARLVLVEATGTGAPCDYSNITMTEPCNTQPCGTCSLFFGSSCPAGYLNKPNVDFSTSCQSEGECLAACCDDTCASILFGSCPTNFVPKTTLDFAQTLCTDDSSCVSACCDATCAENLPGGCPTGNYIDQPGLDFSVTACADPADCLNVCCQPTCEGILGSVCPSNYVANPAVDFTLTGCTDIASCTSACCEATCASTLAGGACPTNYVAQSDVNFATTVCADQTSCVNSCCAATCATYTCSAGAMKTNPLTILCGANGCSDLTCCNPPVDCVGSFQPSSSGCSATCGSGVLTSTYTITTQAANNGKACPYVNGATQTSACNTVACPAAVDCVGSFQPSSTGCSASCGSGVLTSTYTITTQAANNGKACPYVNGATQTSACNTVACPAAVDCVGSFQPSATGCSATCGGGILTSIYTITTQPANNGKACPYTAGTTQVSACNTDACVPVPVVSGPVPQPQQGLCKDLVCPANTVVKQNSATLKCSGNKCTVAECCTAPTCLTVSQSFCGLLAKRISNPGNTNCQTNPCTMAECCQFFATPSTVVSDVTSVLNQVSNIVQQVVNTVVYKSDPVVVVTINVTQPAPPVKRDTGKTTAVIDNYGTGVATAALALVSAASAAKIGVTLPAGQTFSTDIISIERRDSTNNLVSAVSITFYLCSADITSTKLTVYRIGANGQLQNLVDLGGSVTLCTDCLPTKDCAQWFQVVSPTTSSFIGQAQPMSVCGDNFVDWSAGEQCEPPNSGCCSSTCHFIPKGTICRRPTGECDAADTCTGTSGMCLSNHVNTNGLACNAASTAVTGDHYTCKGGQCLRTSWCGNNKLELGEQCEPPNTATCDSKCKVIKK